MTLGELKARIDFLLDDRKDLVDYKLSISSGLVITDVTEVNFFIENRIQSVTLRSKGNQHRPFE